MTGVSRRHALMTLASVPLAGPAFANSDPILLRDLYNKDRSFSDLALGLKGERISVHGLGNGHADADSEQIGPPFDPQSCPRGRA